MEMTIHLRFRWPNGRGRFWSLAREAIGSYAGARHLYIGPIYLGLYPGSIFDRIFRKP